MSIYVRMALAATLIAGTASAQHVNIGIKAGLNVYNINNDNGASYDSKLGFNAGLIGHIHLSKKVALQPEVVYSGQGAKFTTAGVETKYNLAYINVPLMLQYMFDNGFRLQAGPQAGLLVSAKSKNNDNTVDIKNNFKPLDLGVSFGASYIHPSTGVGIDARYNLGLSNINENSDFKSTNRGLQVSLFYIFGHTSKNSQN